MSRPSATNRSTTEILLPGDLPLLGRADWSEAHPWLVQGVTLRTTPDGAPFDLRLRGPAPGAEVLPRWDRLRDGLGMSTVVTARQVHGSAIRVARSGSPGLLLSPPCDGHLTRDPGVLLAVSVADCVPVFLLEAESRTLGLLHGGWRGVAAGILERGIEAMWSRFGIEPRDLEVHLGPAISPERYEVGPEVFRALGLEGTEQAPPPGASGPLDLRGHLTDRAAAAGILRERIGRSGVCVRNDPRFFSHRGGDGGRQMAVMGYRGRPGTRR
jgi:polyphenol oxidase